MINKIREALSPARLVLVAVTAVLITASAVIFKENFLNILPLYISLIVMILQAAANRYALLLGSLNSVLYTIVYVSFGLYGQAVSAFATSFPFQLAAFINWSRRAYGNSTMFKKLSAKAFAVTLVSIAAVWTVLFLILSRTGSSYVLFDNTLTVLGILATVLQMLTYIDYVYFQLFTSVITIFQYIFMIFSVSAGIVSENGVNVLNITVTPGNLERTTYLVYSIYSLICVNLARKKMLSLYREQQEALKKQQHV